MHVGVGVVYVSVFGIFCMYMEFVFGWCASGCESIWGILVICGISMLCISHCMVFILRIFVVFGCLCDV